ncbi:hypothetical protein [Nocardioides sp. B-3]|uniref:hypothetical protein n=1 Tax=Nocardioides sp. B-3 TaxID=2895565 RepID=UPI002152D053|nr:hypothetical protein [Nocardioides sp. B-3]UUZ58895.1 hypothetical protein LP418_22990 [Nocardioides sp. B-3]
MGREVRSAARSSGGVGVYGVGIPGTLRVERKPCPVGASAVDQRPQDPRVQVETAVRRHGLGDREPGDLVPEAGCAALARQQPGGDELVPHVERCRGEVAEQVVVQPTAGQGARLRERERRLRQPGHPSQHRVPC